MKKLSSSIFILTVILIVACQQTVKKEVMEKKEAKVETTGEAVIDGVGSDLNNVNSIEKDLSTEDISDIESGLSDIQNI